MGPALSGERLWKLPCAQAPPPPLRCLMSMCWNRRPSSHTCRDSEGKKAVSPGSCPSQRGHALYHLFVEGEGLTPDQSPQQSHPTPVQGIDSQGRSEGRLGLFKRSEPRFPGPQRTGDIGPPQHVRWSGGLLLGTHHCAGLWTALQVLGFLTWTKRAPRGVPEKPLTGALVWPGLAVQEPRGGPGGRH